jgi:hypothetical protein
LWVLCRQSEQKEGSDYPYELPGRSEINVLADGDAASPSENASKVIQAIQLRREVTT